MVRHFASPDMVDADYMMQEEVQSGHNSTSEPSLVLHCHLHRSVEQRPVLSQVLKLTLACLILHGCEQRAALPTSLHSAAEKGNLLRSTTLSDL